MPSSLIINRHNRHKDTRGTVAEICFEQRELK